MHSTERSIFATGNLATIDQTQNTFVAQAERKRIKAAQEQIRIQEMMVTDATNEKRLSVDEIDSLLQAYTDSLQNTIVAVAPKLSN